MKKALISAVLLAAVCISAVSCAASGKAFTQTAQDKRVVMSVGGKEVQYQEFRYFFLNNKRDSFGADATLTDEELRYVLSLTEENARKRHALIIMAEKYDAKLTAEEKREAENYVNEYRTAKFGNDEEYLIALDEQYLTDHLFRELTKETALLYSVFEKMKASGAIIENGDDFDEVLAGDEIICVKEIYVAYGSKEAKEIQRKRAEEALQRLMDGMAFEDAMREYSDYNEAKLSPEHGYYTMKFDALDIVFDTAKALAIGEHSYVLESETGFHIVKRCKKDTAYMETIRDEIYENYTYAKFNEEFENIVDSMEVVYSEYGAALDLMTIS